MVSDVAAATVRWWKETIVHSGILLVSAYGKLWCHWKENEDEKENEIRALKIAHRNACHVLWTHERKSHALLSLHLTLIRHPSPSRQCGDSSNNDDDDDADEDFECSHFSTFHAEHVKTGDALRLNIVHLGKLYLHFCRKYKLIKPILSRSYNFKTKFSLCVASQFSIVCYEKHWPANLVANGGTAQMCVWSHLDAQKA